MTEHNLFYYPYASFTDAQLSLLKVAALYFDKLFILDPVGASSGSVGTEYPAREAVKMLQDAGILQIVTPADVLAKYEDAIRDAISRDIRDQEFLKLCETRSGSWTLSLAKVPQDRKTDEAMRELMGDFARRKASEAGRKIDDYVEHVVALSHLLGNETNRDFKSVQAGELKAFAETGEAFDELREGYDGGVEYRYADFPLAVGEAIMMNHALFAGLLHADATPITDDPFHNQALHLKLRRASQEPSVQQAQSDRARGRQLKANLLMAAALTDPQLKLPILSPGMPLEEVLEYRSKHDAALQQARDKLGWMARRIEAEPWSKEFANDLEHKTIPDIAKELDEVRKARDAWLNSKKGRLAWQAAGVITGASVAVLAVFAAPLTPVAMATAGLGLASGAAIPGAQWLLDWRDGKTTTQENGLHYLLGL
jgi:hypothetical protein